jgi:hypothetical protein
MNLMNPKDNHKTNDPAIVIEDLSIENAEASNVKGGIELKECLITGYQTSDLAG